MKSITPVISVILLVMLTIVASASAYFFINSNVLDLQSQGSADTFPGSDSSRLNLVSITGSRALVRNDGSAPVTDMVVFVNGELLNYTLDNPIYPGEIKEINYSSQLAGDDLEIKIIYNQGKTEVDLSPGSKNTAFSGFMVDYTPRVSSASINYNSTHLIGYCKANVYNASINSIYSYKWYFNNTLNITGEVLGNHDNENYQLSTIDILNGSWKFRCMVGNGSYNSSWMESSETVIGEGQEPVLNPDESSTACFSNDPSNTWFTGSVNGTGYYCCGNDLINDDFYNSTINITTHFCLNGEYYNNTIEERQNLCTNYDFKWLTGEILGNTSYQACCGDDGDNEIFNNGTSYCCNGSYDSGTCYCGNDICDAWENSTSCLNDCPITLGVLEVNNVSIVQFSYGLRGYCNASSTNSNDIINYNYSWKDDNVLIDNNFKFIQEINSVSQYHSCAILSNGSAVCWGDNALGKLGNGSAGGSSYTPVFVSENYNYKSISIGDFHSCGILTNGSAVCWGSGASGKLGNGGTANSNIPVFVSGNYIFDSIFAGSAHTCGVLTNGSTVCWGTGSNGRLGNGGTSDSNIPVFVSGSYKFKTLGLGQYHSCGVLTNGSAVCWGAGGTWRLGNGQTSQSNIPVFVLGNYEFSEIDAGTYEHSCGVLNNGSALCWGYGYGGEIGNGVTDHASTPSFVSGNYTFVSINLGFQLSCGLLINGSAVCWGYNDYSASGVLGNGTDGGWSPNPVFVYGNYIFSKLASGFQHSCGILINGSAVCWGNGEYNKLGAPISQSNKPVFVTGENNYINNNFYWNNDTFISLLPSSFYTSGQVSLECIAKSGSRSSLPVNYTLMI